MSDGPKHPQLLPWLLSGDLDPERARATEAHLQACPTCRSELKLLAAMVEILKRENRAGYRRPPQSALPDDAGSRAPAPVPGPAPAGAGVGRRAWLASGSPWRGVAIALLAVAGPVALSLHALLEMPGWSAPGGAVEQVGSVTFAPPDRGDDGERVLSGAGPWAVRVVMPFGAPEGSYQVRIERVNRPAFGRLETAAPTNSAGALEVIVGALPGPGRYQMILERREGAAAARYVYPLEVEASRSRAGGPSRPR